MSLSRELKFSLNCWFPHFIMCCVEFNWLPPSYTVRYSYIIHVRRYNLFCFTYLFSIQIVAFILTITRNSPSHDLNVIFVTSILICSFTFIRINNRRLTMLHFLNRWNNKIKITSFNFWRRRVFYEHSLTNSFFYKWPSQTNYIIYSSHLILYNMVYFIKYYLIVY